MDRGSHRFATDEEMLAALKEAETVLREARRAPVPQVTRAVQQARPAQPAEPPRPAPPHGRGRQSLPGKRRVVVYGYLAAILVVIVVLTLLMSVLMVLFA